MRLIRNTGMRKISAFLILSCTLVGCKSLDYVRSQAPVLTGETKKNVSEFAACVSSSWSGSSGHVTSLPLNNGVSLQIPQAMGGYDVVLDVQKTDSGSKFILFERIASLTSASYETSVKQCI